MGKESLKNPEAFASFNEDIASIKEEVKIPNKFPLT